MKIFRKSGVRLPAFAAKSGPQRTGHPPQRWCEQRPGHPPETLRFPKGPRAGSCPCQQRLTRVFKDQGAKGARFSIANEGLWTREWGTGRAAESAG